MAKPEGIALARDELKRPDLLHDAQRVHVAIRWEHGQERSAQRDAKIVQRHAKTRQRRRQETGLRSFAEPDDCNVAARQICGLVERPIKTDRQHLIDQKDGRRPLLEREKIRGDLIAAGLAGVPAENESAVEADAVPLEGRNTPVADGGERAAAQVRSRSIISASRAAASRMAERPRSWNACRL